MYSTVNLEGQLTRVWESVLGKPGIGVHDSFWDLGGNSLQALRLMRRIEQLWGEDLPVSTLLHVPTIAEMAALLRNTGSFPVWSSLVPIQPLGPNPPLFCVHAMGGLVVGFQPLARHLGSDQPLYGLQARGLDHKHAPLFRVEDMATHYLREIRAIQPHGPYYFAGRCFGGWIAYEMAQQLRARGEEVALLALLDSYPNNSSRASLALKLLQMPLYESFKLIFQKTRLLGKAMGIAIQRLFLPPAWKQVRRALRLAAKSYVPRPYAGRITLLRAGQKSLRSWVDPQSGWGPLASGEFDIQEVPGDHNSMLAEPQVAVLAQRLQACLGRVRGEKGADRTEQAPRGAHSNAPERAASALSERAEPCSAG